MQENHAVQLEKLAEPSHHRDFILVIALLRSIVNVLTPLQSEVRRLFKEKLGITRDAEFITHVPVDAADVHDYEYEDGPEPDTYDIAFDLNHNQSSRWNAFILRFFLEELQKRCNEEAWPVKKTDHYIEEILQQRYKQLRRVWRNAQPKLTSKGVLETPGEIEGRLVEERVKGGKESRQATRRRNVGVVSDISLVIQ